MDDGDGDPVELVVSSWAAVGADSGAEVNIGGEQSEDGSGLSQDVGCTLRRCSFRRHGEGNTLGALAGAAGVGVRDAL